LKWPELLVAARRFRRRLMCIFASKSLGLTPVIKRERQLIGG
jgi:hypothetical protein